MTSIHAIVTGQQTVTVGPQLSVLEATRVMAHMQIGAVPVVDQDQLVGIFTERDVLARVVASERDPGVTPVAAVMSTELITAEITEAYDVCLHRMQQAHVRHLIVLDRGRLAGILSLRDLLAVDLSEKDEAITLLNAYVHYVPADLHSKSSH
jgi:CBS domain-containing protein